MFPLLTFLYVREGVPEMLLIGAMLVKYAFYLGMAGMLIVSLAIYRKLELRLWQALLFTVVAFLSDGLGAFLMGKVYTAFVASLGSTETATYSIYGAVFLTPVLVIASAAIIKQPWRNIIDMVAISEMVARAFGKLGCHVGYCCAGFEWEHGVYNARFDTNMFPTQLCEFFTMIIMNSIIKVLFTKFSCREYIKYITMVFIFTQSQSPTNRLNGFNKTFTII